ncbi:MAG: PEGA domain-containing protein [Myxococcota bacterium]
MLSLCIAMFALSAGAAGPADAVRGGERKVAITQLSGLGLENKLVRAFERYLETSVGTIDGVSTITSVDVEIALQDPRNEAIRRCGGGTRARVACAAALGKVLGADTVIYGTIGAIGESYSVNLRAVDVASRSESAKHSATIAGSRDRLIPEVRLAAFKLVAPDKIQGTLKVEFNVAGVLVEIDGREIGTTPLKNPSLSLPPGAHVVVLRRPGFKEFQQEFEIEAFETTRLRLELELLERD